MIFWKIFDRKLLCHFLDRSFARFWLNFWQVTNEWGRWEWHKSPSRYWNQYIRRKLWCNENFEYVLPVKHFLISAFHNPNFTVLTCPQKYGGHDYCSNYDIITKKIYFVKFIWGLQSHYYLINEIKSWLDLPFIDWLHLRF